jgi:hypothetical protein
MNEADYPENKAAKAVQQASARRSQARHRPFPNGDSFMRLRFSGGVISPMMRWLRLLVTFALFLAAAIYIYHHRSDFSALFAVSAKNLLLIAVSTVALRVFGGAQLALLYSVMGARMGIWESTALSSIANALNLFLPGQAGAVTRAVYLKRNYGLPYSHTPAILLGSVVLNPCLGGLVMMVSNLIATSQGVNVPLIL